MNRNDCKYFSFSEREFNEKETNKMQMIVCTDFLITPHN